MIQFPCYSWLSVPLDNETLGGNPPRFIDDMFCAMKPLYTTLGDNQMCKIFLIHEKRVILSQIPLKWKIKYLFITINKLSQLDRYIRVESDEYPQNTSWWDKIRRKAIHLKPHTDIGDCSRERLYTSIHYMCIVYELIRILLHFLYTPIGPMKSYVEQFLNGEVTKFFSNPSSSIDGWTTGCDIGAIVSGYLSISISDPGGLESKHNALYTLFTIWKKLPAIHTSKTYRELFQAYSSINEKWVHILIDPGTPKLPTIINKLITLTNTTLGTKGTQCLVDNNVQWDYMTMINYISHILTSWKFTNQSAIDKWNKTFSGYFTGKDAEPTFGWCHRKNDLILYNYNYTTPNKSMEVLINHWVNVFVSFITNHHGNGTGALDIHNLAKWDIGYCVDTVNHNMVNHYRIQNTLKKIK